MQCAVPEDEDHCWPPQTQKRRSVPVLGMMRQPKTNHGVLEMSSDSSERAENTVIS